MASETQHSHVLPVELIAEVLEHLNYRDLVGCRLVSRWMRDLIDHTDSFQYKLSLNIAGMSDNPHDTTLKGRKRELLLQYNAQWVSREIADTQSANKTTYGAYEGPAWELVGGVLAQSKNQNSIEFIQLPSMLRGVQEKIWTAQLVVPHADFTMDPAQDLLVTIAPWVPQQEIITHLLTMSTGQPHPGARLSTNSTGLQHEQRPSYEIRINGPYVGLLVTTAEDDANILVRNWHTGETLYSTESADNRRIASFVFFDASSILIALQSDIVPSDVVSISSQQGPRLEITRFERDQEERWCLLFPQLKDDEDFEAMLLTCEPGPVYVPPRNENAPFHIFDVDENGKGERLIMLNVTLSRSDASLNVAILSSRLRELLYAFRGVNDDTDWVEWQRWGASSTHMVATATAIWEGTWPCITYGTKAIIMRPQGSNNIQVIVQDFSQLRAMWEHKRQDEDHEAYDRLGSPALEVLGGNNGFSAHSWSQRTQQTIFEGTLATRLLYTQLVIPGRISRWDQVMLSGDSIVVVKNGRWQADRFDVYSI